MQDLPTLQSLADESPRGTKPVYSWLTLTKCAIAGSPNRSLSADEVIHAIQGRFIFFTFERAGDWKTFIINTLSNTPCFSPTGTGVFSPDELYWEYDHILDKDRENTMFSYVPLAGIQSQSGPIISLGSSAAGGSGASTPQHGNGGGSSSGGTGPSGSHPSSPTRERSRRQKRHEDRERRRQARDGSRPVGRVAETQDRERERHRGSGHNDGREPRRERHKNESHHRERARTRERDAPPSRDGSGQVAIVPRPRTKSNPIRPPPLNFGSSSNLRSFVVADPYQVAAQNQTDQNQYRAVLQHVEHDGQELPMPPRLGRERDPDTGSLRSFRSFRSLIDAATGAASGTKERGKSRDQTEPLGTPIAVALPSSSEAPETDQQRRKMEKEQEKARKKLEKEQKKEAEARRKTEDRERERASKVERDGTKAPGLAEKLKTIAKGPSRSGSKSSSISGQVVPFTSEPGSAVNTHSQSGYSAAGRGTPQPGALQSNIPFVLDLLESAVSESPQQTFPTPPKNGQAKKLKKAKSFLLFWKG